jgi:hypothetical protein
MRTESISPARGILVFHEPPSVVHSRPCSGLRLGQRVMEILQLRPIESIWAKWMSRGSGSVETSVKKPEVRKILQRHESANQLVSF